MIASHLSRLLAVYKLHKCLEPYGFTVRYDVLQPIALDSGPYLLIVFTPGSVPMFDVDCGLQTLVIRSFGMRTERLYWEWRSLECKLWNDPLTATGYTIDPELLGALGTYHYGDPDCFQRIERSLIVPYFSRAEPSAIKRRQRQIRYRYGISLPYYTI